MNKNESYLHRIVKLEIICRKYMSIAAENSAVGKSWIAYYRKGLRMNQEQLGKLAGISKQAVSKIEASESTHELSLKSLSKLAGAVDMKVVYGLVPKEGTGELDNFVKRHAHIYTEQMVAKKDLTEKERKDEIFWTAMRRDDRWLKRIWD